MSDLRIYNINKKQVVNKIKHSKKEMTEIINNNAEDLLGVKIIARDVVINDNYNDVIPSLGYDENYVVTVIEYRNGKFGKTIEKGLVYLDYIKQNKSKIKLLFNEILSKEEAKQLIIEPRLICLSDDVSRYDEASIFQTKEEIDLIKYQPLDKNTIILEKIYQSKKVNNDNFKYQFKSREELDLFKSINEFILSLGDEVVQSGFVGFVSYRKITNFIYILFEDGITVNLKQGLKYKTLKIKNEKDLNKALNAIEECYDNN